MPRTRLTLPATITVEEFEEFTLGVSSTAMISLDRGRTWTELQTLRNRLSAMAYQTA